MNTIPIKQPRFIGPELVDIGDDIAVEVKDNTSGLTTSIRGVVSDIEVVGPLRFFVTREGGVITRWQPGRKFDKRITLYGRAYDHKAELFTLDNDEVRERIAN